MLLNIIFGWVVENFLVVADVDASHELARTNDDLNNMTREHQAVQSKLILVCLCIIMCVFLA